MNDYENQYQNPDYDNGPIFSHKSANVRLAFIRKVYLILSAQLLLTAAFITLSLVWTGYIPFLYNNIWILVLCAIGSIVTCISLVCYRANARVAPRNYILLSIFTLCEAILFSHITGIAPPENVIIAAVLTAAMVIALTIYAINTEEDFTICGGMLFMCLMLLIVASIMSLFWHTKARDIFISAATIFLFGIYVIYDTQLIVGDKTRALSIDDYIIGAIMLYIDIMRIFLEIMKILAKAK